MKQLLPWIIIGLSVLGGIALLIYNYLSPDEDEEGDEEGGLEGGDTLAITAAEGKKDEFATTTEEYRGTARKSRMIALKASLERSLDSREGPAGADASRNRMTMPWFMLVGADGSGKRTILANTGLPLPFGPPVEVDSHRKDAGRWWLFDEAVVLEAPAAAPGTTAGAQTLPPGQTVADASVGWNTLLHMLRRERPDSPLNGIIVTIACSDLIGGRANPERLAEQADRIRNFLERTRNTLGVRLPLHILVTKCDALPGFRAFAETLPESRRHDIFGWANPADIEKPFEPGWIDSGFQHIQGSLTTLRDELLAAPEHVHDSVGVFVFDSEFADMQEPLKDFVSKLITEGERRPSLFFRGMYFTGDTIDHSAQRFGADPLNEGTLRISAEAATAEDEAHNLVFLRSVFADKIFKEAGLARPTARFRLARDRRVVILQAAALVLMLGGGAGLWTSLYGYEQGDELVTPGLTRDAELLTRVLSGLAIDLDAVRRDPAGPESVLERRSRDAAVIELVRRMRDVPTGRVRSPFLPTSWFSPLPNDIRQSMMAGMETIVLPVTRQRLQERTDRLLGVPGAPGTDSAATLDETDPRSLVKYLNDVRQLSHNIARYNSLASPTSGDLSELSGLLDYLFGEQLARDTALSSPDFDGALLAASAPLIPVTQAMSSAVVNRATALVKAVTEPAARQLAPRTTPQAERAVRPDEDMNALHSIASLVELLEPERGLVARVTDAPILGSRLAPVIADSIAAQLRLAAVRIARDTLPPQQAADRLRTVIAQVYRLRLMERVENRQILAEVLPNERLRWDVGRLELALAMRAEFLQAQVAIADAFPGQPPDRMRRALEVQLRSRAIDVAASAQRFTPMPPRDSLEAILEVRAQNANLDVAAPRILRLSVLLDSLGAGREGRRLIAAAARQAENALALAQATFEGRRYFTPQTTRILAWQGGLIPFSFAALGVTDSVSFSQALLQVETDIRTLAHDVEPSLKYLRLPMVMDTARIPRLLAVWEGIAESSAGYLRGEASSSLGTLLRYLRDGLSMTTVDACRAAAVQPDTLTPAADVFVTRRRQFRAALEGRCGDSVVVTQAAARAGEQAAPTVRVIPGPAVTRALASYQRLRTFFQSRLASRFPFVDSLSVAAAPDADPAAVREFLRMYDALIVEDFALRANTGLAQLTRNAAAFLDQVGDVRAFLAPLLDDQRNPPRYVLLVGPRAPATDVLVNVTPLELRIGGRGLPVEDIQIDELWTYGDSIEVVVPPQDTLEARIAYANGSGWSLLRFVKQKAVDVPIRFFHPQTRIELKMPEFPAVAPEILLPRSR